MRLFHRNFMDIDLLSKMVRELILVHDRVALPGLGTFVADTVPASFSDKGYTINPPYRKLSFRQGADDDGLLADLYASENSVSREIASAVISDFLSGMREVLEKKKNMVFPGLGRLRATKENNFFFVADEDLDIYPDGFGLAPVSLKTHQETKEEVSSALDVLKDMIVEPVDDSAEPAEPEDDAVEPEDTAAEVNAGTPVEEACQADVQADASDDTEDADAAAGHQHRQNDVSCATQRAGINLDKSKRRISGSHQPQDSHADIDNLRIGGKQPKNKSAKNQQQHADGHRASKIHRQADVDALFHAAKFSCAVVLSNKGGDRDAERAADHPVQ